MPNWCDTEWDVTLPTDKVHRFLNYFLGYPEAKFNKYKGRFFHRTHIDESSVFTKEVSPGVTALHFYSDSAWSLDPLVDPDFKPNADNTQCVCIGWVCEDCSVDTLHAVGIEPCGCFRQTVSWDTHDGLDFYTEDITPWYCDKCGAGRCWEDEPANADRTICPDCGAKLEEEEDV